MSANYDGQIAVIPLGSSGLYSDAPQSNIPPTNLIRADNVTYYNSVLQKDFGSRQWNVSALPAGIVRFAEMFPDSQGQNQRIFTLLQDGTIYRLLNNFTQQLVTAVSPAPTTLNPNNYTCMVVGGNEQANRPKKLFTFTGYDPVQVVSGENTTRTNIASPPVDWSGTNQPFAGLFHRGRLFAWGCQNDPHRVYVSLATNHEDFTTQPLSFSVYPGESDGIVGGAVFRGRLYMAKYPLGCYFLNDTDTTSANWYFSKFSDDFGGVSPQGFAISGDDLIIANNYGSLTSMAAAFKFGDIDSADVFHTLGVRRFFEGEIRPDAIYKRDMMFYGFRRQYFVSYQSFMNPYPDRIMGMDVRDQRSAAKIALSTKDQPNCLGLIRDMVRVPRPFYGASDGFLYQMDVKDRWVGPSTGSERVAYEMNAQTPHMDFSQGNALMGSQVKQFDFIQVEYEPTGDWDVDIDVFIDSRFQGTYKLNLSGFSDLDEMPMNVAVVDGLVGFSNRIPIYGEGQRISLRFRNAVLGQDVRLVKAFIYYKMSGEQEQVK